MTKSTTFLALLAGSSLLISIGSYSIIRKNQHLKISEGQLSEKLGYLNNDTPLINISKLGLGNFISQGLLGLPSCDPFCVDSLPPSHSTIQTIKSRADRKQAIEYFTSSDGLTWTKFGINVGEVKTFTCKQTPFIKIVTQREDGSIRSSTRKLGCQARYGLGWNQEKQLWDIWLLSKEE